MKFACDNLLSGTLARLSMSASDLPQTPAGRWILVDELLNPSYIDGYDDDGEPIVKRGAPLISREEAFKLLGVELSVDELRLDAFMVGELFGAGWDANGSPVP